MNRKTMCLIPAAICILASTAQALPINMAIDFRDNAWNAADYQATWTIGDITALAQPGGSLLYQDSTDGLGIRGGEPDEIDRLESLEIVFNTPYVLRDVAITDLFASNDGNQIRGEEGYVHLYGGNDTFLQSFTFFGNDSDQANGEQLFDFGQSFIVSKAVFSARNLSNNEFSVAGFANAAPVPEPATMLLFGTGLAGLAGLARRRKKA
ncbi:PEP-CTERM sorting domain-containing protein [Desulfofustis glycolicus]|uniref:VPLPA-CTERM protein sorting domain-containing protein n=1 Tax=Desulfofustis glycolicus DSM 9705 TaxID=1121409 RepID=A0A1M5YLG4_9BACT|nr:PEP-CTERM sorting domain-containing protein [Desulfofustis glycolicus]SHI12769.1 VPLPA-CTERM protein sorting domain-containing protein [Desulfofustis glycolicus DSM 9705]